MDDKNKTFLPDNCQNPRGKTTKVKKKIYNSGYIKDTLPIWRVFPPLKKHKKFTKKLNFQNKLSEILDLRCYA